MASKQGNLEPELLAKKALVMLSEQFPVDYKRAVADSTKQNAIKMAAHNTAVELCQTIQNVRVKKIKSLNAFSHLSKERVDKIRSSLRNQTFVTTLSTDAHGIPRMSFIREAKQFRPSILLKSGTDVKKASYLQIASIVVECIILVLDIIGVHVPADQKLIKDAVAIVVKHLSKSQKLIEDVDRLSEAYKEGNYTEMAKKMFIIVVDCVHEGIFWDITKTLLSGKAWYDWVITAGRIAVFIALLVETGGNTEIAKLIAIVLNAADFLIKLSNLSSLNVLLVIKRCICKL